MRQKAHDILFLPIGIGPVKSKNRFYQVPHCSGMGWQRPNTLSRMREVKAEGGWGVVCTEYCSIDPSSDDSSYPFARLWNKEDIKAHFKTTNKIHKHDSLAGVELWIGGNYVANLDSRIPPLGLSSRPLTNPDVYHPYQSKKLDKTDIKNLRIWQKSAAKKAIEAGFDIIYVYATHGYLLSEFLNSKTNTRTDEYGGSLENRIRIVKELIYETQEAVKGKCAVATRFSLEISDPETFDAFSLIADLPDLWDLTVDSYEIEMGVSRYVKEAALEKTVSLAKSITSKPVVSVGRFTSPDTMARVIKNNIQDMIGSARPSIADPFLPNKIMDGHYDDIRECIGCNICYAHNTLGVPIRCTQNPTMGEEWRRNWHPERIQSSNKKESVLIIGAGPAGLESSRVLGRRGYKVFLAEASKQLGGRVTFESNMPGLSEWIRVRDWRVTQINKSSNIEIFLDSHMNVESVIDVNPDHILIATGSSWTIDGIGKSHNTPIPRSSNSTVVSLDTILHKKDLPSGKVLIFDDDHYYIGPVIALYLIHNGYDVTLVTPAGRCGQWGYYTEELYQSNAELLNSGVEIITNNNLVQIKSDSVQLSCIFSGKTKNIAADWIIPITRREPKDKIFYELNGLTNNHSLKLKSLKRIGDCEAPGIIASAVYSGYKSALELGKNNIKLPSYNNL